MWAPQENPQIQSNSVVSFDTQLGLKHVETLPVGSGKTGPWPLLSLFLLDVSGTSLLLRFARAHKSLLDSTSTSRCANFLFSTVVSQKILVHFVLF